MTRYGGRFVPPLPRFCCFFLFAGLASSVDPIALKKCFTEEKQRRGLLTGVFCQFFIVPSLAFMSISVSGIDSVEGTMLLIVASSPGGAFSNFYCNLMNADLTLSIAMTTTSTVISLFMLPVNSLLYIGLKYGQEVPIKYSSLALSLVVVVAGVGFGLAVNWWGVGPHEKWKERLYTLGNISGLASIVLSLFASEAGQCAQSIFSRDLVFYLSIWAVSMTGLLAGCIVAQLAGLPPPQRCAVAVETTYQNIGIAATAALTMFESEDLIGRAVGVPMFYGLSSSISLGVFLLIAWKVGWTLAPSSDPICQVLWKSYQPVSKRVSSRRSTSSFAAGNTETELTIPSSSLRL